MSPVKQFLIRLLQKLGYEIRVIPLRDPTRGAGEYPSIDVLDLIIRHENLNAKNCFFIQIGAHDGESYDPIRRYLRDYSWRGIMVEPQPQQFANLQRLYKDNPRIVLENAAVGNADGEQTLYTFKPDPSLPYHATMLASFYREALVYNTHGYRGEIVETKVPTISARTLLSKHAITHVDLLQIDTEGFDKEIVKMFMSAGCLPKIVHFEDPVGIRRINAEVLDLLASKGYSFSHLYPDTIAYLSRSAEGFRVRTTVTQKELESLTAPKYSN